MFFSRIGNSALYVGEYWLGPSFFNLTIDPLLQF